MIRVEIERKKKVLHELKKRILKEGIVPFKYVTEQDGKQCHCAVGHLMSICGVEFYTFLDDIDLNTRAISYMYSYSDDDEIKDIVEKISNCGFTEKDLRKLQSANDAERGIEPVVDVIDELMEELTNNEI